MVHIRNGAERHLEYIVDIAFISFLSFGLQNLGQIDSISVNGTTRHKCSHFLPPD